MSLLQRILLISFILITGFVAPRAQAQDIDMPRVQQKYNGQEFTGTYPMLRMTQDKSEMLHLDAEAASVVVGNPNHISVLLDTPDTIIVVPRAAGASHFTVTGKDGSILMQRHVIVGGQTEQYVRIRRSCNGPAGGDQCQKMSTYFCPDTCHEVQENISSPRRR
jgi:Flp pilus assembly secretin CpaC